MGEFDNFFSVNAFTPKFCDFWFKCITDILGLIAGVLRHYFLDRSIFVAGRYVKHLYFLPKFNYKKNADLAKMSNHTSILVLYAC